MNTEVVSRFVTNRAASNINIDINLGPHMDIRAIDLDVIVMHVHVVLDSDIMIHLDNRDVYVTSTRTGIARDG